MSQEDGKSQGRSASLGDGQSRQIVELCLAVRDRLLENPGLGGGVTFRATIEQSRLQEIGGDSRVAQSDGGADRPLTSCRHINRRCQ